MTKATQNITELPTRRRQRRVALHALVTMAVLIPLSVGTSYVLAASAGAQTPGYSAGLAGLLCLLGSVAVLWGLDDVNYPHDRLGLCNIITLTRGAGIAILAGLVVAPVSALGWGVAAIAAGLLLLDGLDGWVARRSGLRSRFGARFDVESDVVFALTLALLAWQADKVGAWFLLLGLLRPLFLGAAYLLPLLRHPLPDARWRKTAAGIQMSVQVALLTPVLNLPLSAIVGASLLIGMVVSFAVDVRWLLKRDSAAP